MRLIVVNQTNSYDLGSIAPTILQRQQIFLGFWEAAKPDY